ncbi:MAG TPA: hypothetical protein VFX09_07670 [Burkholderiales bacterium]|nr:hypothetical protein [Burkholderiales bacterium]
MLIDDYTRRAYVDGRALRLPAVLVRPGTANTAVSGWSSAIIREPLAGRDYVCPVRPDTRMACISLGKVVESLVLAETIPSGKWGLNRTLLLTGVPVSAGEMWQAVKTEPGATGQVSFQPDDALQKIMDASPKATSSRRAGELGFPKNHNIQEIVDEYKANLSDPAFARHG